MSVVVLEYYCQPSKILLKKSFAFIIALPSHEINALGLESEYRELVFEIRCGNYLFHGFNVRLAIALLKDIKPPKILSQKKEYAIIKQMVLEKCVS